MFKEGEGAEVACSDGDTAEVEEGGHIGWVDAVDGEGDDAGALFGVTDDGEVRNLAHLGEGVVHEGVFPSFDAWHGYGVEEVDGGAEADHFGYLGSACFEAVGWGEEFCLFEVNIFYHSASCFEWGEGGEKFFFSVEDADAGWAVHFMAGEGEEVAVDIGKVDSKVWGTLSAVDEDCGAIFMGEGGNFFYRVDCADDVGDVDAGYHFCFWGEEFFIGGHVELA